MGMVFKKERRRRRRIQARNGSIPPIQRKEVSLCQEDGHSQDGERLAYSGLYLPEDIWCYIHSLIPLRDSARSACVSRTFLHSWKCHPKLIFTKEALGLKRNACEQSDIGNRFTSRVDQILQNHTGIGVKTLRLVISDNYNVDTCHCNSWLQNAITPGIEEVDLFLPTNYREEYNFPCSVLLNGRGSFIRFLHLTNCAFRPTIGFDCLRSLTKLHLYEVRITGDELGYLISNSFGLEQLELMSCRELISLKIPFWLEHLSCVRVSWCKKLQVIEITAPNLSSFDLFGDPVQLSLGESSQVKNLRVGFSDDDNIVSYYIKRLPRIVPHLEKLKVFSNGETVNTPIAVHRFLQLKHLKIYLEMDYGVFSPTYDYLSLVSFLDASPALETFILSVNHAYEMEHDSVYGNVSHMRQIHGHKHHRLLLCKEHG